MLLIGRCLLIKEGNVRIVNQGLETCFVLMIPIIFSFIILFAHLVTDDRRRYCYIIGEIEIACLRQHDFAIFLISRGFPIFPSLKNYL